MNISHLEFIRRECSNKRRGVISPEKARDRRVKLPSSIFVTNHISP